MSSVDGTLFYFWLREKEVVEFKKYPEFLDDQ